MNETNLKLEIRIHGIDGFTRTFNQSAPDIVNGTLEELLPTRLFTQDRIVIADDQAVGTFFPPLLTRIDLITEQLSVWDFPFILGALVEITEAEFRESLHDSQQIEQSGSTAEFPVVFDIEMVTGLHTFLRMEIIAGFPVERLLTICSLLRERRLIFGLRAGGVGVLNLANMVRFLIYPEPQQTMNVPAGVGPKKSRGRQTPIENQNLFMNIR